LLSAFSPISQQCKATKKPSSSFCPDPFQLLISSCPASIQLLPAVEALLVAVLEILSLADDDDAPLRAMSKYLLPALMTAFGKLGGSKAVD
jgi:hypothetical protein